MHMLILSMKREADNELLWQEYADHISGRTSKELMDSVETVSLLDMTPEFPDSPPSHMLLATWESLGTFCRLCAGESLSEHDTLIWSAGRLFSPKPGTGSPVTGLARWMSLVWGSCSMLMLYFAVCSSFPLAGFRVPVLLVGKMTYPGPFPAPSELLPSPFPRGTSPSSCLKSSPSQM